ncbi:hypothetical protein KA089_00770 [Candidatus Woesebacteria bacterium]|nr:hypothetical protein [Candidatus Woesebacteria bacterium]
MKEMTDNSARLATPQESEGMLELIQANAEAVTHLKGACALWWETADMITVFNVQDGEYLFVVVPHEFQAYFKKPGCGNGILKLLVKMKRIEKKVRDTIMTIVDRRLDVQLAELAKHAPMSLEELKKIVAEDKDNLIAASVLETREMPYGQALLLAVKGSPVAQYLVELLGPQGFADAGAGGPGVMYFDVRRN